MLRGKCGRLDGGAGARTRAEATTPSEAMTAHDPPVRARWRRSTRATDRDRFGGYTAERPPPTLSPGAACVGGRSRRRSPRPDGGRSCTCRTNVSRSHGPSSLRSCPAPDDVVRAENTGFGSIGSRQGRSQVPAGNSRSPTTNPRSAAGFSGTEPTGSRRAATLFCLRTKPVREPANRQHLPRRPSSLRCRRERPSAPPARTP